MRVMPCLSGSFSSVVSHTAEGDSGHPRKRTWHLGILRGVKINTLLWLVHVEAKPTVGVWAKTIALPCISQILCLYLSEVCGQEARSCGHGQLTYSAGKLISYNPLEEQPLQQKYLKCALAPWQQAVMKSSLPENR